MSNAEEIGRREAAELLDVHPDTVSKLLHEGLEVAVVERNGQGGALIMSRRAVLAWKAARRSPEGLDPKQERARRDRAQADLAEQRYRERAGELLEADDVVEAWSSHIGAARTIALSWEQTESARLHRAALDGGELAVARELRRMARHMLEELAGGSVSEEMEAPARCGAPTSSGTPCRNPAGPDGRCHIPKHQRPEAAAA